MNKLMSLAKTKSKKLVLAGSAGLMAAALSVGTVGSASANSYNDNGRGGGNDNWRHSSYCRWSNHHRSNEYRTFYSYRYHRMMVYKYNPHTCRWENSRDRHDCYYERDNRSHGRNHSYSYSYSYRWDD